MTFRSRLVVAATAAVLVVVILASLATYLVAYNSLVGSVDTNLSAESRGVVAGRIRSPTGAAPPLRVCARR